LSLQDQIYFNSLTFSDSIYVPVNSNNQIMTYYHNIKKNNNFLHEYKFKTMLNKFIKCDNICELLTKIEQNINSTNSTNSTNSINGCDSEIFEYIKLNRNINYINSGSWRHIFTCILSVCISNFVDKVSQTENNINFSNLKYLDIGCGDGKKTQLFSKLFGIHHNNVYGTDIEMWGPYAQVDTNYSFKFKLINNNKLNYRDNNFDVISCFLTLHHVENLSSILKEIKRILKPNGILIVIEHDVQNDYDHLLLNILHSIYTHVVDNNHNTKPAKPNNHLHEKYYNWLEWQYIFESFGYETLHIDYLFTKPNNEPKYDNAFYYILNNNK